MVVTTLLVWVRLQKLPLHFFHHQVLKGIGNTVGKLKNMDLERTEKDIFTFTRIYVEINLNKSSLDHIMLKHNKN